MSNQIQVGEAVYMAGSPHVRMTVTKIDNDGRAHVEWITRDGDLKLNVVPPAALRKVDDD